MQTKTSDHKIRIIISKNSPHWLGLRNRTEIWNNFIKYHAANQSSTGYTFQHSIREHQAWVNDEFLYFEDQDSLTLFMLKYS